MRLHISLAELNTNPNDFRQKLKDALMEDMPTIIQINAARHTDDGILSNNCDLSMEIGSMDRVTRPCANTNEHIRECFSEISGKKPVIYIS